MQTFMKNITKTEALILSLLFLFIIFGLTSLLYELFSLQEQHQMLVSELDDMNIKRSNLESELIKNTTWKLQGEIKSERILKAEIQKEIAIEKECNSTVLIGFPALAFITFILLINGYR